MFSISISKARSVAKITLPALDHRSIDRACVKASLCYGDVVQLRRAIKRAVRERRVVSFHGVERTVFVSARIA